MNTVVAFGHNRLDYIKRRIADGHARLAKGGAEWVEGSLETALALREGREAVPADISFGNWLKQNQLDFFNKNDRTALIGLAADIELARKVLTESDSRCYQQIWVKCKARFPSVRKPTTDRSPTNGKRRARMPGRANLFRTMKLGEAAMNRIKGTSLDSSDEMDELVILNRGTPDGTLTEVVARLIDAAANGEAVSAIAEGVAMGGRRGKLLTLQLLTAWNRRMTAPWKLASKEQRAELVYHLAREIDPDLLHKAIEKVWDEQKKGG